MIALVDERLGAEEERSLLLIGARVIRMPASRHLPEAVRSHPDMLAFYNDRHLITSADYCEEHPHILNDIYEAVRSLKISCTEDIHGASYPHDAIFNALVIKNYIFYKEDTVSAAVREHARERGLTPIPVKQGYPACTALAFGNSAITADRGMAKAMSEVGIKVTLIENGGISLPPHEYGFIGGAAGVFGDKVYFIGDITRRRDFERIDSAIRAEGYTPVSLSRGAVRDLGRIVFIEDGV